MKRLAEGQQGRAARESSHTEPIVWGSGVGLVLLKSAISTRFETVQGLLETKIKRVFCAGAVLAMKGTG
ncbi:MAG: hypothetical protein HGA90_02145 [Alphaproteobacteria bacterium]|nr:hypothetical protein [Alphaproteobacteria bacterium]